MAVGLGNMQSVATGGWWLTESSTPSEPGLTLVNNDDGESVTATVDGDAGVTNTLYYRKSGDAAWTAGESRTGDGDITQSDLTSGTLYTFVVVSDSAGIRSLPSASVAVVVTGATQKAYQIEAILNADEQNVELEILASTED